MVSTERWGCWCCEHYVPGGESMVCRFHQPSFPYGPECGCEEFQPLLPTYGNRADLRKLAASDSSDDS